MTMGIVSASVVFMRWFNVVALFGCMFALMDRGPYKFTLRKSIPQYYCGHLQHISIYANASQTRSTEGAVRGPQYGPRPSIQPEKRRAILRDILRDLGRIEGRGRPLKCFFVLLSI